MSSIGVGSAFGDVKGQPGITGSKHAFEKLMAETKDEDSIEIEITDPA